MVQQVQERSNFHRPRQPCRHEESTGTGRSECSSWVVFAQMHGARTNTPVDHVANLEADGGGGKMSFRGPANRSAALVISVSNMAS